MRKLALLLTILCCAANAQEVYKWTDENGKVHFGDRSAAPADSKKITVKVQPPTAPPVAQGDQGKPKAMNNPARAAPARPGAEAAKESVPVDPAKVGPKCKGLVDQIANVKRGTPWESLARDFNDACPGIAYECVNYKAHPENNTCTWIERTGSNILHTKNYP